MVDAKHDNRAANGHKSAVEIEVCDARDFDGGEQVAACHSTNDAQHEAQRSIPSDPSSW